MTTLALILLVFIVLEFNQLSLLRTDDTTELEPKVARRPSSADPISGESSYEMGNRLIQLFCVVMIGSTYYCLGWLGTAIALVPIFMVAALLDAFWIRVCLYRTPLVAPPPAKSRRNKQRRSRSQSR